jgi:hydrogenase maturation protease
MTLLGIGNVLQKDDGFGVYAARFLKENYRFTPDVRIIEGGVEGINLYNVLESDDKIVILDTVEIDDTPGSIYAVPADELRGRGINSGGAHEVGVLQVLDMLELQGKAVPETTVLGIVPQHITFDIALSETLRKVFDVYIETAIRRLENEGFFAEKAPRGVSLEHIIERTRRPR